MHRALWSFAIRSGMAEVFVGDVPDEPAVRASTTQITAQLRRVEALVCNATGPQADLALTDTSGSEPLDRKPQGTARWQLP